MPRDPWYGNTKAKEYVVFVNSKRVRTLHKWSEARKFVQYVLGDSPSSSISIYQLITKLPKGR